MKERLLQLLQAKRPDLYDKINQAEITEDQLLAHLGEGLTSGQQWAATVLAHADVNAGASARPARPNRGGGVGGSLHWLRRGLVQSKKRLVGAADPTAIQAAPGAGTRRCRE